MKTNTQQRISNALKNTNCGPTKTADTKPDSLGSLEALLNKDNEPALMCPVGRKRLFGRGGLHIWNFGSK